MTKVERFNAVAFLQGLFESTTDPVDDAGACSVSRSTDIHPEDLPDRWREVYEERAGIMEYDAEMTRADAEEFALREILAMMREAE